MMRKVVASAAALGVALSLTATPASAQLGAEGVYCFNCSTIATQLLQQVAQAEQLINSAAQLESQLQSYANMLKNTASLPATVIGDVKGDIDRVRNIWTSAKGIAYTASNLDEQFASKFKGIGAYRSQGMSAAAMSSKYTQWSEDTNDSVQRTFRALGSHSTSIEDDYERFEILKDHMDSADGQKQAIDVTNELLTEVVQQNLKLRELLMMQIQLQAQDVQTKADQEAADRARAEDFFRNDTSTYDGRRY